MLQEQEGTGGAAQAPEARARGQQPGRHGGHQAQVSNAMLNTKCVCAFCTCATSSKMDNCTRSVKLSLQHNVILNRLSVIKYYLIGQAINCESTC